MNIKWQEAFENSFNIKSIAVKRNEDGTEEIVGYNGVLKGDLVSFFGKEYIVVKVSNTGTFELSENKKLPGTVRATPNAVKLVRRNEKLKP